MTCAAPLPQSELRALVSLLDDREPAIARTCRQRLEEQGSRALPFLDEVAVSDAGRLRIFARAVARGIRLRDADREFLEYTGSPGADIELERGMLLLSRTANPDLNVDRVQRRLDRMARDLVVPARRSSDPEFLSRAFRETLGHRLRGDRRNFFDPQNSFIDRVLDRRLGIPISLSAVYLFVARRRRLPLYGVGMPGHFVVQCGEDGESLLDPFDGGSRVRRSECLAYLDREGYGASESFLRVTPDRMIVARMIANLLDAYRRFRKFDQARRYAELFEKVTGEPAPL